MYINIGKKREKRKNERQKRKNKNDRKFGDTERLEVENEKN